MIVCVGGGVIALVYYDILYITHVTVRASDTSQIACKGAGDT